MCVGVQVVSVWGDHGSYTGRCRYGAPLGTMQAAIQVMDRRRAVGTSRAKTTALACATLVVSAPLNKWIKAKGFDLEDQRWS